MKATTKILGVGIAAAVLAAAAPAAAQYYPGYSQPYGYGQSYPGQSYPGYGYGNAPYGGYAYGNVPGGSQIAVSQCSAAVQQRLGYSGYGYGYGAGNGRILGINSVEIRNGGGYKVRGVASAGGYGYAGGTVPFSCRTDPRGYVVEVDLNGGYRGNGYGNGNYGNNGYANPYGAYGYQRY